MDWANFQELGFDPPFPAVVIVGLGIAAALLAIWREVKGRRRLAPRWFHAATLLMRLGVVALLVFLLMNPVRHVAVEAPAGHSVILVDRSASMSLGAAGEQTRWEAAKLWASEVSTAAGDAGLPVPETMFFSSQLEPATADAKPDGKETRMAEAITRVLSTKGSNPPDEIIIVSDGVAHDRHALAGALALAGAGQTPISTHLVGIDTPPRNAWITAVAAPRIVRPQSTITVHVDIAQTGFSKFETLALVLTDQYGEQVLRDDFQIPDTHPSTGGEDFPIERVLSFPAGLRTTNYTLELMTPGEAEIATEDNRSTFTVEISSTKMRVLFVEGTHVKRTIGNTGHWMNDMELMTRAWEASGDIEYTCLTPVDEYTDSPNLVGVTFQNGEMRQDPSMSFPATRDELFSYDVMLISDVPVGNFSDEQMQWVVEWVLERGGGFLMGGGYTTFDSGNYDQTPWERIIPVDMMAYGDGFFQQRYDIDIPQAVRRHPLWRISDDPDENNDILDGHTPFTGMNRVTRAKPGALVLATRRGTDQEPVIAVQNYGRGRSIAFLPDPNGGWAKFYVSWGPPGGTPHGAHTELGHGHRFVFIEEAANSATGPIPPHPSPYYAKFWINTVRWLGENSIRWRRDKLAGRVASAQARPGRSLPVAAEVVAVSGLENLLALDVAARLDLPGSPRVRLEYDRDRREFVGELAVPADVEKDEVRVLFDTTAERTAFTDSVPVGIQRGNREYAYSTPDANFMQELAIAGGGGVIGEDPAEAVAELRRASEERARNTVSHWNHPLWDDWSLWAIIAALLGIEWALRRRGIAAATVNETTTPIRDTSAATTTRPA